MPPLHPFLNALVMFAQQTPPPAGTTVTIPDNLASWILGASGAAIIVATFGKSAVNIIKAAGDVAPRLMEARAQQKEQETKQKEIETSALQDLQKAFEALSALIPQLRQEMAAQVELYRKELREQGARHDQEISELRGKYIKMNEQYDAQGVLLTTSAQRIKALEDENEAICKVRDELQARAENAERDRDDYKQKYERASAELETERKEKVALVARLALLETGEQPAVKPTADAPKPEA